MTASLGNGALRQALSEQHKDRVKTWVPKVRRLLEEDFARELDRLGLKPDGQHKPVETMRLPVEDVPTRGRLEALLRRETLAEGTPQRGFATVQHELAYTLLNRLVGLKAMEARGLLYLPPPGDPEGAPEPTEVLTPIPGQAFSRYLRDVRAAGGSRYKYHADADEALLRDALTATFRFITREIGVVFDPEHEYSCLWPTYPNLVEVICSINEGVPVEAYRAQDFLGWVYQFFNREEKRKVRAENKGTPRSSYELSVINQFYTPSWIVKTLVDNTLGRLWLQMHPDSCLAPKGPPPSPVIRKSEETVADYLVPRTGEKIRFQRLSEPGDPASFKHARDIKIIDPACGTMHFGQYAFGLFHRMYLDEIEHAGEPGWPETASVENPQDIPAAIVENNLFGIDIDPRAIQIASLALLLTAKEAALRYGYSPIEVHIRRTNLVVANAVNFGPERLRALVERVGYRMGTGKLRERLFTTVWENLQHVGTLGSLVQVRETVSQVLTSWVEARAQENRSTRLVKRFDEQATLDFDESYYRARTSRLDLEQNLRQEEASRFESELFDALDCAAAQADEDPVDRLFAEDTSRGLKLLRLLSSRYDIVLMNPPYGAFVPSAKPYAFRAYGSSSEDIYASFLVRAVQLVEPWGFVGALVSSTFKANATLRELRSEFLLKQAPLIMMLDLGFGVLDDATVEAAALVLGGSNASSDGHAAFFALKQTGEEGLFDQRHISFVEDLGLASTSTRRYDILLSDIASVEGCPLAYDRINLIGDLARRFPSLESVCEMWQGVTTRDDPRFIRYFWEVMPRKMSRPWVALHKGGDFSRFYYSPDLVIDWSREAKSAFWRLRDPSIYFKPGLTWPRRTAKGLNMRKMSEGCVFGDKGPAMFLSDPALTDYVLGVCNSKLVEFLAKGKTSFSWELHVMRKLPIPLNIPVGRRRLLESITEGIFFAKASWDEGNEVSSCFRAPWTVNNNVVTPGSSLVDRLDCIGEFERAEDAKIQQLYGELNDLVYELYELSEVDRAEIESTLENRPPEILWPQMEGKSVEQKRIEHVFRLLSYVVRRVVEADEDGVVPFVSMAGEPSLLERVLDELHLFFPDRDIGQVEIEVVNELNKSVKGYRRVRSIAEWLENVFFEYHADLYKSRPIFWHIASSQGTSPFAFGALVHYHKFNRDRIAKLRSQYLRDSIDTFRREAGLADKEGRADDRADWQARLEEAQELDRRLQWVQEGHREGPEGGERDFRILTPWKTREERPLGWDPDLDDGVKVNIEPLQKAGVLRIPKVI